MEPDYYLVTVGAQIRHWRKNRDLTLRQLAEITDIDHSNLSKLEKGTAAISLARLDRIAKALDVPLAVLVDGDLPYVDVIGQVLGAGYWAFSEELSAGRFVAYPVILPHRIPGAVCAYKTPDGGHVICGQMSPDHPIPGAPYIIVRKSTVGELDRKSNDAQPIFETAVRTFHRDEELNNPLSRAAASSVPVPDNPLNRAAPVTPQKGGPENPLIKELQALGGDGFFEASEGPLTDRYIRFDRSTVKILPVIGQLLFDQWAQSPAPPALEEGQ